MSNLEDQPQALDPAAPVFRPGEFTGREGLVRNLLRRLKRGESLNIIGGPKLGKTSLLRHIAWQWNQASSLDRPAGPSAIFCDLANEEDFQHFKIRSQESHTIMLFDNCDKLLEAPSLSLSALNLSQGGPKIFAGARAWREAVKAWEPAGKIKSIPLAVFLEKEAYQLLRPELSPEHRNCVLTYAGTHPFLIKKLQAEMPQKEPPVRLESIVDEVKQSFSTFFQRCLDQLQDPLEQQVLSLLIEADRPVNPGEVAKTVGRSTIKPVADTLCSMGLIARWIREEEAALSANSRLFNEWYREFVMR